jgi:hypothetical protein
MDRADVGERARAVEAVRVGRSSAELLRLERGVRRRRHRVRGRIRVLPGDGRSCLHAQRRGREGEARDPDSRALVALRRDERRIFLDVEEPLHAEVVVAFDEALDRVAAGRELDGEPGFLPGPQRDRAGLEPVAAAPFGLLLDPESVDDLPAVRDHEGHAPGPDRGRLRHDGPLAHADGQPARARIDRRSRSRDRERGHRGGEERNDEPSHEGRDRRPAQGETRRPR